MSASPPPPAAGSARPIVVDLVRAYEGLLLGVVLVLVALVASGGPLGPAEFAALLVVPAVGMVFTMRRGAPREVFRIRVTGALLGWALAWVLFPALFEVAYAARTAAGGETVVFTILALLDGIVLGLVLALVDRIGSRRRSRKAAGGG